MLVLLKVLLKSEDVTERHEIVKDIKKPDKLINKGFSGSFSGL
jgi:hypothetical protein